jgi:hypothetical protein
MEYYVYQYLDENNRPYYIGKGNGNRIHAKHNVQKPTIDKRIKVAVNLSEFEAYTLETKLIRLYGRKLDGGILENIRITSRWTRRPGWKQKEETKQIIRDKNTGKKDQKNTKKTIVNRKQKNMPTTFVWQILAEQMTVDIRK